eukprot:gnl/MRDRNA2_/MRDRNA2_160290_c0_seq1.p1 gnl/MRDRNA2_/MRDRNA2_160290_c0~~gnl/MRDRNA2_/MRDRNA2_160290_c0_seq1.p1  ORF type:complete len:374 (-),score=46.61 gnl/MRDRNA2_/MRDRNA2_160290_c0_seq1:29-1150(-)
MAPALPPFYTARYVEVRSPVLSLLWLLCGIVIVVYTLIHSLLGQHNYVHRETPNLDVTFWQDVSVDGTWWPTPNNMYKPSYCDMNFVVNNGDGLSWGSEHIGCKRPSETPGTYFYPSSNQILVAFSLAHGKDPQYNTRDVWLYEGIEKSSIGFQLSFISSKEHIAHVQDCVVIGDDEHPEGYKIQSRYETLFPKKDYGEGYLILSVEDVLRAAGRRLDGNGSEAPLRLSGLEVVAKFDLRNYHVPYSWPLHFLNPLGFELAKEHRCTVRFEVLRDQFMPIKWFYHGTEPVALQHGLRLSAVGTGSIGYFSIFVLLEKLLLGFAAFGLAQVVLDLGWYYLYKEADTIAKHAYDPVVLNSQLPELPFKMKRTKAL